MRPATLIAMACAAAFAALAQAEEKQDRIIEAVNACAPSLVRVKYECLQTDGKASQEFQSAGIVVGEGLVMVSEIDEIDPPVGGRYQKPAKFAVHFDKDTKAQARFLGKDEELNLALLQLTPSDKPEKEEKAPVISPLKLGDFKALKLAQEVLVVSKLDQDADFAMTFGLLRVTAVIPKPAGPPEYRFDGRIDSWLGCPVLSLDGAALGFVAAGSSSDSPGQTITMGGRTITFGGGRRRGSPRALCVDDFKEFLADPSKFLRRKGWLGVRGLQALGKELAEHFGVKKGGVILGEILSKSPAERAGLKSGDIVLKIDGEELGVEEEKDVEKFSKKIQRAPGGTKFKFSLMRRSQAGAVSELDLDVSVEEEPKGESEVEEWEEKTFGLRVKPLTRDFLDNERLPIDTEGVRVMYTESAGFAQLAGLQRNDIVQGVVLVKTPDLSSFQAKMAEVIAGKEPEVCFSVIRGGKKLFLCVRPEWAIKEGEK